MKRGVFEMGEGNADAYDSLSVREAIMFQKEKSATALPLLVWYLCVRKGNAITCMFLKRLFMTREDKSASYLSQIQRKLWKNSKALLPNFDRGDSSLIRLSLSAAKNTRENRCNYFSNVNAHLQTLLTKIKNQSKILCPSNMVWSANLIIRPSFYRSGMLCKVSRVRSCGQKTVQHQY